MNIWFVTIGNSDVQLKSKANWNNLVREVRSQLNNRNFQPILVEEENFIVPARVMGIVYGQNLNEKIYNDLHFPLLDALSKFLTDKSLPDKIIIILTNQEAAFTEQDKRLRKCPYWQDTCKLKPILDEYFRRNFTNLQNENIIYLELTSQSKDEGLDNWDKTLGLVQKFLSTLTLNPLANIYVSHQAGTPAISSAIQFISLAKFGKQVKFLVTNEYEQDRTNIITSSSYLRGIQLQEAKVLLERFDYSGVENLLKFYWLDTPNPNEEKLRHLLKIAIQWNCANFEDFKIGIKDNTEYFNQDFQDYAQDRFTHWWWTGYEAAYLATVRLEQGNTVEALFHSFRAIEGIIRGFTKDEKTPLYKLILTFRPNWQLNPHVKIFNEDTRTKRNNLFHQLLGLEKTEVFQAWKTSNQSEWEARVLGCLDFISGQNFISLQEASLMCQVHQELKEALNDYELSEQVKS
ncbi:hypothetical protein BLD44_008005 [Mastigocladus laminosus UU774]|nr:hypothetical protein BLD44_008005 [Mastigocladus laminosus UU774]